jgi:hypothetical protein
MNKAIKALANLIPYSICRRRMRKFLGKKFSEGIRFEQFKKFFFAFRRKADGGRYTRYKERSYK